MNIITFVKTRKCTRCVKGMAWKRNGRVKAAVICRTCKGTGRVLNTTARKSP